MPQPVPIFPERLVQSIVDACPPTERTVVAVDGADAAQPVEFASVAVEYARSLGRAADVVNLHDYVRPASIRFEYSRTDELSYRTLWFDYAALAREVIAPLRVGGSGRFLPRLWDESSDRSARAGSIMAAPNHIVVVAGPMLLGRDLDFDLTVGLLLSRGALQRRTVESDLWTVEPLLDHADSLGSQPDYPVRWDHPDRPALVR